MNVKKPTKEDINKTKSWGTWSKEVSTFPWIYDEKETCLILEGEALVSDKFENQISFRTGDWVEFEQGLECTWNILSNIKKKYKFG